MQKLNDINLQKCIMLLGIQSHPDFLYPLNLGLRGSHNNQKTTYNFSIN